MSRIAKLADYLEHEFTTPEDREQIAAILRDVDELMAAAKYTLEYSTAPLPELKSAVAKIEAHK